MPTSRAWTRAGLSAIAGLRGAGSRPRAARFAAGPAAEWVSRLSAAGIGAQR